MLEDITTAPLGEGQIGAPVYLHDFGPSAREIEEAVGVHVTQDLFD